jgi:hypothetical protein
MGGIADRWGVSQSFFILGALMLLLCLPRARRPPRRATSIRGRTSNRLRDRLNSAFVSRRLRRSVGRPAELCAYSTEPASSSAAPREKHDPRVDL